MIRAIKNGFCFLSGWCLIMCLAASMGFGCKKEPIDPLWGPWKAVFPIDAGSGFWFRDGGMLCRYADKDSLHTFNCRYEYAWAGDTVTVSDACGYVDAWRILFISPDVVQAVHVEYDSLPGAPYFFIMKRDTE